MNIKQPFPALPDYDGPTSRVFSCVHHNILAEFSWNILERLEVIDRDKPESERATRKSSIVYLDPTGQPWEQPFRERAATAAKHAAAANHRIIPLNTTGPQSFMVFHHYAHITLRQRNRVSLPW